MSSDDFLRLMITGFVLVSAPFAIRATWRLWRLWRSDPRRSLLLLAYVVVSLIVTTVGAWIGFLLARRMLGMEPLDWTAPITGVALVAVLQIPAILDGLVQRTANGGVK